MKVLVFIGPSGSGKSTLIQELVRREEVVVTPSWTTRPPRANETGGDMNHRFVTDEEFTRLQNNGYFVEVIEMYGFRYGLPAIDLPPKDKIPAILVRAPLLHLVSAHYPEHIVYQIESDLETAIERVGARQTPRPEMEDRLRNYSDELALGRRLSHRVFDTAAPLAEVADSIERAIAEDFDGYSIAATTDHNRSR